MAATAFAHTEFRSASLGGMHFYQRRNSSIPVDDPDESDVDVVSVSVFRLRNSYRDTLKYANGLLLLADAVESHFHATPAHDMPQMPFAPLLRIYYDATVAPERMQQRAEKVSKEESTALLRAATIWDNTWKALSARSFVRLIYFQADEFFNETLQEHADLFGTIVRFLPLFDGGGVLPSWACAPKDGRVVFLTDADFQDFNSEHGFIHLCSWFTGIVAQKRESCAKEGVAFRAAMRKQPDFPTMAAFTIAGSMALRHKPVGGLPPIIANCMCTSLRYPLRWFTEWYEDCASGRGFLLGRYCMQLHAPTNLNTTYEKRKIADQTSLFPFGCDEQMLANVLKPRAMCDEMSTTWLYLVMPNVDILVRKCVTYLQDSLKRDPTLCDDWYILTAAMHTAFTAGVTDVATQLQECLQAAAAAGTRPRLPTSLSPLPLEAWAKDWPNLAQQKVGVFQRFETHFLALDKHLTGPFIRSFHTMIRAFVEAVAAGRVYVDDDEYELLLQNLTHFGRMTEETFSVVTYRVGAGAAYQFDVPNGLDESLFSHLRGVRGCKVEKRHTEHLAKPSSSVIRDMAPPYVVSTNPRLGCAYGRYKGLVALMDKGDTAVEKSVPTAVIAQHPTHESASPWVPTLSRSQGKYYWFNKVTQETSWQQPPGAPDAPSAGVKRGRDDTTH